MRCKSRATGPFLGSSVPYSISVKCQQSLSLEAGRLHRPKANFAGLALYWQNQRFVTVTARCSTRYCVGCCLYFTREDENTLDGQRKPVTNRHGVAICFVVLQGVNESSILVCLSTGRQAHLPASGIRISQRALLCTVVHYSRDNFGFGADEKRRESSLTCLSLDASHSWTALWLVPTPKKFPPSLPIHSTLRARCHHADHFDQYRSREHTSRNNRGAQRWGVAISQ